MTKHTLLGSDCRGDNTATMFASKHILSQAMCSQVQGRNKFTSLHNICKIHRMFYRVHQSVCPQCCLLLEKPTNNSFPSQLLSIPMNHVTHDNGYLASTLQTTHINHIKKFISLQGTEKLLSTNKGLDKKTPAEFRSTTAERLVFFQVFFFLDYLRNYL
jgi:hypothetical protein